VKQTIENNMNKKRKTTSSAITHEKLQTAIESLRELANKLPDLSDEVPCFSFATDGKKAKVVLMSASLSVVKEVSFWEEVSSIGKDDGSWYYPNSIEFWIKTFRKAADKLERELKYRQNKPKEWTPIYTYR
jgi:hypothetical protein